MSKKSVIKLLSLCFIMFIAFIGYGLMFTQLIVYMESIGMSASLRGLVLTISSTIGILLQLFSGYLSDKTGKTKHITITSHVILALLVWLSYSVVSKTIWVSFLALSIMVAVYRLASNLLEMWFFEMDDDTKKSYGSIRVFGSLGWALGAYLVAKLGYTQLGVVFAVLIIFDSLLMLGLPNQTPSTVAQKLSFSDVRSLFKNREYVLLLIIFFWLFLISSLNGITVIDRLIELQASQQDVGTYWTLQAIVELPLFIFGGYLISKLGSKKILQLSSLFMLVRYVLYGLSTQVNHILWVSVLQIVTFPLLLLSQKHLVSSIVELKLRSSAHMLMTAITSNITMIVAPLLSGILVEYFSIQWILGIAGVSCLVPLLVSSQLSVKGEK